MAVVRLDPDAGAEGKSAGCVCSCDPARSHATAGNGYTVLLLGAACVVSAIPRVARTFASETPSIGAALGQVANTLLDCICGGLASLPKVRGSSGLGNLGGASRLLANHAVALSVVDLRYARVTAVVASN